MDRWLDGLVGVGDADDTDDADDFLLQQLGGYTSLFSILPVFSTRGGRSGVSSV